MCQIHPVLSHLKKNADTIASPRVASAAADLSLRTPFFHNAPKTRCRRHKSSGPVHQPEADPLEHQMKARIPAVIIRTVGEGIVHEEYKRVAQGGAIEACTTDEMKYLCDHALQFKAKLLRLTPMHYSVVCALQQKFGSIPAALCMNCMSIRSFVRDAAGKRDASGLITRTHPEGSDQVCSTCYSKNIVTVDACKVFIQTYMKTTDKHPLCIVACHGCGAVCRYDSTNGISHFCRHCRPRAHNTGTCLVCEQPFGKRRAVATRVVAQGEEYTPGLYNWFPSSVCHACANLEFKDRPWKAKVLARRKRVQPS